MREGHSPASGVADLLVNASWFGYDSVAPSTAGTSGASTSSGSTTTTSPRKETAFRPDKKGWLRNDDNEKAFVTKAKFDKQLEQNEELRKALKAAKNGSPGPQRQPLYREVGPPHDQRRDRDDDREYRNQRSRR